MTDPSEMTWRRLAKEITRTLRELHDLEAVARRMKADRILWTARKAAHEITRDEFDGLILEQARLRAAVTQGMTDGQRRLRDLRTEQRASPRFAERRAAKRGVVPEVTE